MSFPLGKHVTIDPENPDAVGICDYTGFVFNRKDLIRQMEWRGNALVWTGFYVGKPYADKPNPQLRPPILPPDPVPIVDPRPPQNSIVTWDMTNILWNQDSEFWNQAGGTEDGIPALPEAQRVRNLQSYYWVAS